MAHGHTNTAVRPFESLDHNHITLFLFLKNCPTGPSQVDAKYLRGVEHERDEVFHVPRVLKTSVGFDLLVGAGVAAVRYGALATDVRTHLLMCLVPIQRGFFTPVDGVTTGDSR